MKIDYGKAKGSPSKNLPTSKIIGAKIRDYREGMMMSQRHLAERAGTSQSRIASIENGANITLDMLDKIAVALNRDIAVDFRRKLGN